MSVHKILWEPHPQFIQQSNLKKFELWLLEHKGLRFDSYQAMWHWSTEQIEEFWECIWDYFNILAHQPYQNVLRYREMPDVQWFTGSTLNYAEHIFRHKSSRPAFIYQSEIQNKSEMYWPQLENQVLALQKYLRAQGIGKGDCVAAYLPNIPQAIIAFLAVNSLGAIWSCCSPDFGVNTVIDRFSQIHPKLFLTVDGYRYNGKEYDRLPEIKQIIAGISSIQNTVLIPYLNQSRIPDFSNLILWEHMLSQFQVYEGELTFTAVPFNHPIWVLYSSGTTGKPKAITHSHGGVLLEHLKYHAFHNDTRQGDHYFWYTTTGWMMWNFLVASMLMGATPVLFDGSPGYPDLNVLWELCEQLPVHHFGTSPPFLNACMKHDLQPGKTYNLRKLRSLSSTGAPLSEELFDWVYQNVSSDVWLCSMSGGTDVCTAFVGGCVYLPVIRGRIQSRALGCALKAYDENGKEVTGSLGEMVVEKPMPSMPVFFWQDPDNQRYLSSYFERFPGTWWHGDWVKVFEDGSLTIQGRADATLNRKGIRIGTAEIYSVLNGIPGIQDSLVVNVERRGGNDVMPLFLLLDEQTSLNDKLQQKIVRMLREHCSPRHVPDFIKEVPDIPYTLSGKKMEVPIKKILMGMDVSGSLKKDAVRNPEAVDFFLEYAAGFREEFM